MACEKRLIERGSVPLNFLKPFDLGFHRRVVMVKIRILGPAYLARQTLVERPDIEKKSR